MDLQKMTEVKRIVLVYFDEFIISDNENQRQSLVNLSAKYYCDQQEDKEYWNKIKQMI